MSGGVVPHERGRSGDSVQARHGGIRAPIRLRCRTALSRRWRRRIAKRVVLQSSSSRPKQARSVLAGQILLAIRPHSVEAVGVRTNNIGTLLGGAVVRIRVRRFHRSILRKHFCVGGVMRYNKAIDTDTHVLARLAARASRVSVISTLDF